jgi:hypothetical protein
MAAEKFANSVALDGSVSLALPKLGHLLFCGAVVRKWPGAAGFGGAPVAGRGAAEPSMAAKSRPRPQSK